VDTILAFPSKVFAIAITGVLGPSFTNVIIAIAFYPVRLYARRAGATALRLNT
jgi:peptide/nickel transport system permease protein